MDFERARESVPRAETVATAGVPGEVARYSLGEEELPFETLLALAAGRDPDPHTDAVDDTGPSGADTDG